eukprot:GHUV01038220.1.p2 GENE.GHUV01038220.1~~GHUV01038220.1.p2  ORF type:complete len:103 (+),score=19.43 GHUV01038220.1:249-557(+)
MARQCYTIAIAAGIQHTGVHSILLYCTLQPAACWPTVLQASCPPTAAASLVVPRTAVCFDERYGSPQPYCLPLCVPELYCFTHKAVYISGVPRDTHLDLYIM